MLLFVLHTVLYSRAFMRCADEGGLGGMVEIARRKCRTFLSTFCSWLKDKNKHGPRLSQDVISNVHYDDCISMGLVPAGEKCSFCRPAQPCTVFGGSGKEGKTPTLVYLLHFEACCFACWCAMGERRCRMPRPQSLSSLSYCSCKLAIR